MITQRDIDTFHVEAQDFAEKIKNEFMQSLMGNRANRQQGAMRPPAPQPQAANYEQQNAAPPANLTMGQRGGKYG